MSRDKEIDDWQEPVANDTARRMAAAASAPAGYAPMNARPTTVFDPDMPELRQPVQPEAPMQYASIAEAAAGLPPLQGMPQMPPQMAAAMQQPQGYPQAAAMPQMPRMPMMPVMPAGAGNPLQRYFRKPGIHLHLPSGGHFSAPGDVEVTVSGEIPVYPMTTADEVYLKNPDALLNGHSLEQVIKSCVPGIRNIRNLPNPDVDALLLAIRCSTYGDSMEVDVECPECQANNSMTTSIRYLLETMRPMESEYSVRLEDDLVAFLRPYTFSANTRVAMLGFEETKRAQVMKVDETMNELEKIQFLNESFARISKLNTQLLAESVIRIYAGEEIVEDPRFIAEFIANAPKAYVEKIENLLREMNDLGVNRKMNGKCSGCGHEWEFNLTFDPSSFFG